MSIPLILGVTIVVFCLVRVLPGDPARVVAGLQASQEEVKKIQVEYGLNKPLYIQYGTYLHDLLHGNLGKSIRSRSPVAEEIMSRFPNTLLLISISLALASIVGIPLGILSAAKRHTVVDHLATPLALFGISMPVFWSGLMLMLLFSVTLRWLPAGGAKTPIHFILPSFTLSFALLANILRLTRSSMLEILTQDYVQTARSKGVREGMVVYKHALKNAIKPVVTIIGLQFGTLLGGTVLTETVFAWPGIGRLMVNSIFSRDYIVLQGLVLIFSLIIVVVNLLTDLSYGFIDPRIRYN